MQVEKGKQVYMGLCFACHQPDGKGLPMAFPPLAGSDYMLADRDRAIRIVLKGLTGPVVVNGQTINSAMPPQEAVLTDAQIADVMTYVFNAWGNQGDAFTAAQVKAIRNETH
jgi:nitrite reductase (NO-forming)